MYILAILYLSKSGYLRTFYNSNKEIVDTRVMHKQMKYILIRQLTGILYLYQEAPYVARDERVNVFNVSPPLTLTDMKRAEMNVVNSTN